MRIERRQALCRLLFGVGGIGLRSFATGIPIRFLLQPREAMAQELAVAQGRVLAVGTPQFLVMSSSQMGDPLNCNTPGTYADPKISHPASPTMAPTQFTLGAKSVTAALPWSTLTPSALARTHFFHHRTDSVGHGDLQKSLRISGGISRGEILPSLLSSQTVTALGAVQPQPISLGAYDAGEALLYGGRGIPMLRPTALKDVLSLPNGPLKNVRSLRDDTLNRLTAWHKKNATAGQATFLDRWANTQTDLRKISDALLNNLAGINSDKPDGQIAGTVALLQLKASPAISIHIPFGQDNHGDGGLNLEAQETVAGVGYINTLMAQLAAAGLADQVTFAMLNVFGRTLVSPGLYGREHNEGHHVTVLIGKNVKAGVSGGLMPTPANTPTPDFVASGIDSSTGAATTSGDIPPNETFSALAKTVGTAVGLPASFLNDRISAGKIVTSAVVT